MMRHTRIKRVSDKRKATTGRQWSTLTAPRKPVRKRNQKRAAANLERAHGDKARREWITTLPCYQCGHVGHSEGAHIKNGGGSRKADAEFTIPLCGWHPERPGSRFMLSCHGAQHAYGWSELSTLNTQAKREAAARDIAARWLTITQEAAT